MDECKPLLSGTCLIELREALFKAGAYTRPLFSST